MGNHLVLLKEIWEQDERWMLWRDAGIVYLSNGQFSVEGSNAEMVIRRVWFYYFSENDMWRQSIQTVIEKFKDKDNNETSTSV